MRLSGRHWKSSAGSTGLPSQLAKAVVHIPVVSLPGASPPVAANPPAKGSTGGNDDGAAPAIATADKNDEAGRGGTPATGSWPRNPSSGVSEGKVSAGGGCPAKAVRYSSDMAQLPFSSSLGEYARFLLLPMIELGKYQ